MASRRSRGRPLVVRRSITKQYWSEAVDYGKEIGKEEGKLQTALAVLPILLSQGKTIEEVAVICGVPVEKLKEIYKN